MKKSALFSAIAAVVVSSSAYSYTSATLTGPVELIGTDTGSPPTEFSMQAACPVGSWPFVIDGPSASDIRMLGDVCLEPAGAGNPPFIRVTFGMSGAFNGTTGTVFNSGYIRIDVQTTSGGWAPFDTVNVSTNNVSCLATGSGGLNGRPTSGMQVVGGTTITVPGSWGSDPDTAVCVTTLFGTPAALFLQ